MKRKGSYSAAHFAARVALSAALIAVFAMIAIPFFVPFTLQTLALYLVIYTFGARVGLAASAVYTALGLVGLPVFAGFSGGVGKLVEPSGGFIIGLVLAAAVSLLVDTITSSRATVLASALSLAALFASGALVLAVLYSDGTLSSALALIALYILPYLIPDVIKIVLAALIARRLKRHIKI